MWVTKMLHSPPKSTPFACSPGAGQLRGSGRAQLIKNTNERWGHTAVVAFRRCKLRAGFVGSSALGAESPSPCPLHCPSRPAWSIFPTREWAPEERKGENKDEFKKKKNSCFFGDFFVCFPALCGKRILHNDKRNLTKRQILTKTI